MMSLYVLGNSVCFSPPGDSYYDFLVKEYGEKVVLCAGHAHTALQFEYFSRTLRLGSSDSLVINYGVVEAFSQKPSKFLVTCTTRMLDPKWAVCDFKDFLLPKMRDAALTVTGEAQYKYFSLLDSVEFYDHMKRGIDNLMNTVVPSKCTVLGMGLPYGRREHRRRSVEIYNYSLEVLAAYAGFNFVDCARMLDGGDTYDGVHFTASGHYKVFEALKRFI